jgi:hypothetical protein
MNESAREYPQRHSEANIVELITLGQVEAIRQIIAILETRVNTLTDQLKANEPSAEEQMIHEIRYDINEVIERKSQQFGFPKEQIAGLLIQALTTKGTTRT